MVAKELSATVRTQDGNEFPGLLVHLWGDRIAPGELSPWGGAFSAPIKLVQATLGDNTCDLILDDGRRGEIIISADFASDRDGTNMTVSFTGAQSLK